jgi:hypothetical protein
MVLGAAPPSPHLSSHYMYIVTNMAGPVKIMQRRLSLWSPSSYTGQTKSKRNTQKKNNVSEYEFFKLQKFQYQLSINMKTNKRYTVKKG